MANPFLMTDDDVVDMTENTNEIAFNPFLAQAGEGEADFADNPFLAGATNPFAGFGEDESAPQATALPEISAPQSSGTDVPFSNSHTFKFISANSFEPTDVAMSFFGTTIQETEDDLSISDQKLPNPLTNLEDGVSGYSSEDELVKKKAPPRPLPPSQTTQDLIFAVADQLDQASSQMLGRLPKTRSPSPVSMRDLHSPSPTPDAAMADFLDCSDDIVHQDTTPSAFEQDLMASSSDNPFAMPSVPAVQSNQAAVKHPPRPPPPRPVPPRPQPPAPVSQAIPPAVIPSANPVQQAPPPQPQNQEPDLFDMFDAAPAAPPKPPAPKTKEDILSLFNAPKPQAQQQQAQPDLLSDDILGDISSNDFALPPPLGDPIIPPGTTAATVPVAMTTDTFTGITSNAPFPTSTETFPVSTDSFPSSEPQPTITEPPEEVGKEIISDAITDNVVVEELPEEPEKIEEPQKVIMDSITPDAGCRRAPTPDIEITTVESLPRSDDEEEQPDLEKDNESGVEMDDPKSIIAEESDQSHASESNVTTQAQQGSPPLDASVAEVINDQEQMDTGLDFAPSVVSGSASANPFASPETEDVYPTIPSHQVTNIFAVEEPTPQPSAFVEPFAAAPAIVPHPATPMPNIFAVDDTIPNEAVQSDDFDAFSAKFDSARKEPSLLDGFGGTTPVAVVDDGKSLLLKMTISLL